MQIKNVIVSSRTCHKPEEFMVVPDYEQTEVLNSHEASVTTLMRQTRQDLGSGHRVLFVDGLIARSAVPSVPFPVPVSIDTFVWEGERVPLVPPLDFSCDHDEETKLYELTGVAPYDDILLYGESIGETICILEEEVLPMFWEDGMDEDANLSSKMQRIVRDLKGRVKIRA